MARLVGANSARAVPIRREIAELATTASGEQAVGLPTPGQVPSLERASLSVEPIKSTTGIQHLFLAILGTATPNRKIADAQLALNPRRSESFSGHKAFPTHFSPSVYFLGLLFASN
jgi:hypothetical protein